LNILFLMHIEINYYDKLCKFIMRPEKICVGS